MSTADEQPAPGDLEAFHLACLEIGRGQVEFAHPAYVFDALKALWDPSYLAPSYELRAPDLYLGMTDQFRKDIQGVDRKLQGRVLEAISHILVRPTDIQGDTVKPLRASMKGYWRYRLGDFRLIYLPEIERARVTLVSFGCRGDAYD